MDTESNIESLTGDDIEKMIVSVQPMNENFTTITDSVKAQDINHLSEDYFVTKGQRINHDMISKCWWTFDLNFINVFYLLC